MRTGTGPGAKAERVLTAMASAAIAHELMDTIWNERTIGRTMGFGPFPKEVSAWNLPPAWKPVYHMGASILTITSPEVSARHAKAVLDSSALMIPGYLQMKTSFRGAKEEGFEGFMKSIIRYTEED